MDYFSILSLYREPFSNSPDPDFFFQSRQHVECLQKLELALRLRRGLNVVIGAVGTGKTTLCRQLIRRFSEDENVETHLILDPGFARPEEFLVALLEMLHGEPQEDETDLWQLKERIKQAIFRKGVDEEKTVCLIIDEGQKIPSACLELLREFLNYETNENKLLQIVIFAQTEFETALDNHANFADRINLKHVLEPLSFRDTRMMIRFRLQQSSENARSDRIFSFPALWAVYRATGGYPRKIIHLCHQCLLTVIIQNRKRAGWALVRACSGRKVSEQPARRSGLVYAGIGIVVGALIVGLVPFRSFFPIDPTGESKRVAVQQPLNQPVTPPQPTDMPSPPAAIAATPEIPADKTETANPTKGEEPVNVSSISEEPSLTPVDGTKDKSGPVDSTAEAIVPQRPALLGQVWLEENETLYRLIEKVYGVYENRYMKQIREKNPHIRNPNRVEVGQAIAVPAIPAKVSAKTQPAWWVKLGDEFVLDTAIDVLRRLPPDAPPVRLVPNWNPRDGLRFSVLLRAIYPDPSSAQAALDRLNLPEGQGGELISLWTPDTVFYSNPYRKPRR